MIKLYLLVVLFNIMWTMLLLARMKASADRIGSIPTSNIGFPVALVTLFVYVLTPLLNVIYLIVLVSACLLSNEQFDKEFHNKNK